MTLDVERFTGRRNDERWNRMVVGDIIERMTWNEPEKEALVAAPDAVVDPAYARVTYRQANSIINRVAHALLAMELPGASRIAMLCDNSNEAWLAKIGLRVGRESLPPEWLCGAGRKMAPPWVCMRLGLRP